MYPGVRVRAQIHLSKMIWVECLYTYMCDSNRFHQHHCEGIKPQNEWKQMKVRYKWKRMKGLIWFSFISFSFNSRQENTDPLSSHPQWDVYRQTAMMDGWEINEQMLNYGHFQTSVKSLFPLFPPKSLFQSAPNGNLGTSTLMQLSLSGTHIHRNHQTASVHHTLLPDMFSTHTVRKCNTCFFVASA